MREFLTSEASPRLRVALLAFIVIAFRVVEVFYLAWFFGVSLTFAQAFLGATLPGIALLLPVPGGIGFFEGGFAAVFETLGIPLSAVAFALLIRLRDIVFIAIGSFWIARRGERLLRPRTFKMPEV
jgi:uncharacterized membrane protein YbhN (UPF0104 family)